MEKFDVTGMTCAACAAHVEKAVRSVKGVTAVNVALLTNSMTVEGEFSVAEVTAAVKRAGYGATLHGEKGERGGKNETPKKNTAARLISSAVLLVALMYVSMGHVMWAFPLPKFFTHNHMAIALIELLLTTAIMIINGRFFVSGGRAAIHLAPNMDTLVALGAGVSYVYSLVIMFTMTAAGEAEAMSAVHGLYFESAAMILTLVTLGKTLEERAKGKTTDAIGRFMKLAPETAVVLRGEREEIIPAAEVKKGDVFIIRPGSRVPVDGVVISGEGAFDESALTGESLPVDKAAGDRVSAATVNMSGFLKCEAVRVGEDTAFAEIVRLVEGAAATKAPIARLADKVAGVFVPAVLLIAAITAIIWAAAGHSGEFALRCGISVLVISCPCALGLATPVAVMVGSGLGARRGILFKTAEAIEKAGRTRIVALDKTGTITEGKPVVTDVIPFAAGEDKLLGVAYGLERASEHPLGRAIVAFAEKRGASAAEVTAFKSEAGKGLIGIIDGMAAAGGSPAFMAEMPTEAVEAAERLAGEGKTVMCFSLGGELLGIIAVADAIKPDSAEAIAAMRRLGIETVMLTGDNERTALAIGGAAGLGEVRAGLLPADKERAVRELKARGVTAMVGDGVNDAPALTAADVGLAIGAGTDVAVDAADAVLVNGSLMGAVNAIRIGRATLRNIRENLFWAFFYNVAAIPLAAGALYPALGITLSPMIGAVAMSFSSVCVVLNALRLGLMRFGGKKQKKKTSDDDEILSEEVGIMTTQIKVEGMMCAHCEATVVRALEDVEGVLSAKASAKKGTATVKSKAPVPVESLIAAVRSAGYTARE